MGRYDPYYRLYVIELKDGTLYVGSTFQSVKERYRQHRTGDHLAARICKSVGCKRLRPDLTKGTYLRYTRAVIERDERALAHKLRAQGFTVHQS